MLEWTRTQRYQKYSSYSAEYRIGLRRSVQASDYRLQYHIQPETGLLNDPNGFSYYHGQWHLFYQSFPFGPVHGLKSWQHLISNDLVHWEEKGAALNPDSVLDAQGVYSGSARPIGDKLAILYTGNVRDKDWIRHPYQVGALMDQQGYVHKLDHPLISQPKFVSDHFRDPMMFVYDHRLFAIIGAQKKQDQAGAIYLYQAKRNDFSDWQLVNELHFSHETQGYMIECPNLVFIAGRPLLLFCPQGLDHKIASYRNIYPNQAILGTTFLPEEAKISQPQKQVNLDEGFDLYATQAFNAPDGRVLAVSWIGLPDVAYPTDTEGWSGCLSLVKELSVKNNQLYEYPVSETKSLRQAKQTLDSNRVYSAPEKNNYELQLQIPVSKKTAISLFADPLGHHGLSILVDTQIGIMTVDRSGLGSDADEQFGAVRQSEIPVGQTLQLNCFIDSSVFEIYVNRGEKVMTGRVFPAENHHYLQIDDCQQALLWPLQKTNSN